MFADFLLVKMQELEKGRGRRMSLTEFADYLGVNRPILSHWMMGNTDPSLENVRQLVNVLGTEVYDVLGIFPPDPLYNYMVRNWDKLDEATRRHINEEIESYLAKQEARRKLGPSEASP